MENVPGSAPTAGSDNSKVFAIVGYILPILFFVPLLTDAKTQPFARFHANQQLLLLIWYVIANVIVVIPILGWIASPIMWVIGVVLAIMGIVNAAGNTMKPLPIIGKYTLLK
jgi:uncharacterized membrane protein